MTKFTVTISSVTTQAVIVTDDYGEVINVLLPFVVGEPTEGAEADLVQSTGPYRLFVRPLDSRQGREDPDQSGVVYMGDLRTGISYVA